MKNRQWSAGSKERKTKLNTNQSLAGESIHKQHWFAHTLTRNSHTLKYEVGFIWFVVRRWSGTKAGLTPPVSSVRLCKGISERLGLGWMDRLAADTEAQKTKESLRRRISLQIWILSATILTQRQKKTQVTSYPLKNNLFQLNKMTHFSATKATTVIYLPVFMDLQFSAAKLLKAKTTKWKT